MFPAPSLGLNRLFVSEVFHVMRAWVQVGQLGALWLLSGRLQTCRKAQVVLADLVNVKSYCRLKSIQFGANFMTIFLKCANFRRVWCKYYYINLYVSRIYEAGPKDCQVHTYNQNLRSTFLKMLKCYFAMFSICQAITR